VGMAEELENGPFCYLGGVDAGSVGEGDVGFFPLFGVLAYHSPLRICNETETYGWKL